MSSRAERLLQLMQHLRLQRRPVTASQLAQTVGVSTRTIYRDIESLRIQGAEIDGDAGLGYQLRPNFTLPPLMFTEDEIQALVLGMRWVSGRTDSELSQAARHALSKISAVLPTHLRMSLETSCLLIGSSDINNDDLIMLRQAIQQGLKVRFDYEDAQSMTSTRTVWPCAIGFFDSVRLLVAWCELRQDFRHFRIDRMTLMTQHEAYPSTRSVLLKRWRQSQNIPEDIF